MRVICYGDSNTYGYDPRSYFGGRYDAEFRWVDILAAKTGWEVHNSGMNGREIPRWETAFPKSTDLLIVMLGTNDLLQRPDPATVATRMEAFLNGLTMEKGNILLIAPPPIQLGEWVPSQSLIDTSVQLAKHYQILAERLGVRFADAGEWNIPMAFDGVHFSEEGHKAFAEGLFHYLNKGD